MSYKILALNPFTKMNAVLLLMVTGLMVNNLYFNLMIVLVMIMLSILTGLFEDYFKPLIKTSVILGLTMFFMISVTTRGDLYLFGFLGLEVYQEGILKATFLVSRIILILSSFLFLFKVVDSQELTYILAKMGFSPLGIFVIKSTFQMIPELSDQMMVIRNAQQSRGMNFEGNLFLRYKKLIPLIMPLVLSSFYNTEQRALVLESRNISTSQKVQRLYQVNKKPIDKILNTVFLIVLLYLIYWKVA